MRQLKVGCVWPIAGAATLPIARPAAAFFRNDLRFMNPLLLVGSTGGPAIAVRAAILALIQARAALRELHHLGAHLVQVRGVGLALEVIRQVLQRRPPALQPVVDIAPVAPLAGGLRR